MSRIGDIEITAENEIRVKAGSSAAASETAALLRADVLKREKTIVAKIRRLADAVSNIADEGGPMLFGAIAWVIAAIAIYFAYTSFSRLFPDNDALSFGFGLIGAAIVIGIKLAASRLARAIIDHDQTGYVWWAIVIVVGISFVVLTGASYQAAIEDDRGSGTFEINSQITTIESNIRQYRNELDDMRFLESFTVTSSEDLGDDLKRMLSRPARNQPGNLTGDPVGDHIGLGTEEYCLGDSFYVQRYCPDILALEGQLRARVAYEDKEQQIVDAQKKIEQLRASKPKQSSTFALAENWADGTGQFFVAAGMLAFLDILMVIFAGLATWSKLRTVPQQKDQSNV
ncbi:MAG: hypothetical protein AAFY82_00065 [Pseudomonadota bacterium]